MIAITSTKTKKQKLIFFKISLAVAGITEVEFARRTGVSRQAIRQVLVGETTSAKLEDKIDKFINENMQSLSTLMPAPISASTTPQEQVMESNATKTELSTRIKLAMSSKTEMELGRRIKQSIKKSGITQGEIAVKLNISQNALSNYSNGKRIPDAIIIGKLARLCEVDPVWLLLGEEFKIPIARIPAPPSPLHEEKDHTFDAERIAAETLTPIDFNAPQGSRVTLSADKWQALTAQITNHHIMTMDVLREMKVELSNKLCEFEQIIKSLPQTGPAHQTASANVGTRPSHLSQDSLHAPIDILADGSRQSLPLSETPALLSPNPATPTRQTPSISYSDHFSARAAKHYRRTLRQREFLKLREAGELLQIPDFHPALHIPRANRLRLFLSNILAKAAARFRLRPAHDKSVSQNS